VITIDTTARVRRVTLNRPEARNALDPALSGALTGALLAADADDDVDVVVLTGADPAFCAGMDLKAIRSAPAGQVGGDDDDWMGALLAMAKPVIGAVNGPAVTAGLELALGCDILVASERARFVDTHAGIGLLPGRGMTALLPRAAGLRMAKELTFTGAALEADAALRLGLVNHVTAHDDLLPVAHRLAAQIAAQRQPAVRELKRLYDRGAGGTFADALAVEAEAFRTWRRPARD
jgi:enoyl-CoA hydratase